MPDVPTGEHVPEPDAKADSWTTVLKRPFRRTKVTTSAAGCAIIVAGLTGCASTESTTADAHEPVDASASATSSATPDPPPTSAADDTCGTATRDALEELNDAWRSTGSANPGDSTTPLIATTWVTRYRYAMSALSESGCDAPPYEIAELDQAVSDLQTAIDEGWGLYGAIPRVAQELRVASEVMGIDMQTVLRTCRKLTDGVAASFTLLDEGSPVGQSLYPRITVTNNSNHGVIVDFDGEGRATSEFGDDIKMHWGGYTDSRMRVQGGTAKSLELGKDTGETLGVYDGQHLLSASIRADVSSIDGALTGCQLQVTGD